jgi:hypothetical protein
MSFNNTTGLSTPLQSIDTTSASMTIRVLDSTSEIQSFRIEFISEYDQNLQDYYDYSSKLTKIRLRSFEKYGEAWRILANL